MRHRADLGGQCVHVRKAVGRKPFDGIVLLAEEQIIDHTTCHVGCAAVGFPDPSSRDQANIAEPKILVDLKWA
jgi:hypothetical protein